MPVYRGVQIFIAYVRTGSLELVQEALADLKMMNFMKPGVFYLKKMMNFMKMRTFYKKLPLFIKNSILHTYKKNQTSNMSFIKNSIFGTFRDPCSAIFFNSGELNTHLVLAVQ